jgi:hypothetical protein
MAQARSETNIFTIDRRRIPPIVLSFGSLFWRIVAAWSNIEFLMSIREEKFRLMLQGFLDWGWIVLIVIGIAWFFLAPRTRRGNQVGWVVTMTVLAFLYGILVAVNASGAFPNVIAAWGGDERGCWANVVTQPLRSSFRKDYNVVLVCGVSDPSVDALEDERITFSSPFNISGQTVRIAAPFSTAMRNMLSPPRGQIVSFWFEVIVIPKNADRSRLKRLSDVPKHGGKIIRQQYYDL